MKLAKLKRKLIRQSLRERRKGKLTAEEFAACIQVARNPVLLERLNNRIEAEIKPGLKGADWQTFLANLWDWFVANWPAILRIILTIVPLIMEKPDEDS